jgi:hypothetical protein
LYFFRNVFFDSTLKGTRVTLSGIVRHHKPLRTLDTRDLGPIHCDRAICILKLDVQVALLKLDNLTGNAITIFKPNDVFLFSRGAHCAQSQEKQYEQDCTMQNPTVIVDPGVLHFPPLAVS